jgi:hypothetical protein
MPASDFSIVISANDTASKTLDQVNRRLKLMNAPVAKTQKAFDELSKATGMTGVLRATRDMSHYLADSAVSLTRMLPSAASLSTALTGGVAGLAAGLAELMKGSADWGNKLNQLSTMTGVTPERLQKFGNAAAVAGGSADAAQGAVGDLARNMFLLRSTGQGDPKIMAALHALGVNAEDAQGHLKKTATFTMRSCVSSLPSRRRRNHTSATLSSVATSQAFSPSC